MLDKFQGGHPFAAALEGRGEFVSVVGVDGATLLPPTGSHVKGLLACAAVGGLCINGHQHPIHVFGLARLGCDGVAVGELPIVGRYNPPIGKGDGAALENLAHRDQFAVGEFLTAGRPAIGTEEEFLAVGHGDGARLENGEAVGILGRVEKEHRAVGLLNPQEAVLRTQNRQAFVAGEQVGLAAEKDD